MADMTHERQVEVYNAISKRIKHYTDVATMYAQDYARTDNPDAKASYKLAMVKSEIMEEARNIFQDGRVIGKKLDT